MQHVARYKLHATCYVQHVAHYKLHATCYVQHVAHYKLHATCYVQHVACNKLHAHHCNDVARKIRRSVISIGILVVIAYALHTHAAITCAGDV